MSSPPKLKLENQICHSLYSATNALVRTYRPLLDALDLTYPQYLVMLALWDQDHVMIKHLVACTRFDAGTLTPILKRLEAKHLITMSKSKDDARQKLIVLSDEGHALQRAAASIPDTLRCQVAMSQDDALQLKALCEQLYALLDPPQSPA